MMVAAMLIGRGRSRGVPGKNVMPILGRPLMTYPLLAAANARHVDRIFVATESSAIQDIGIRNGAEMIALPDEMTTEYVLVETVVVHGYEEIRKRVGDLEMLVLLFCNSGTITPGIIDRGIEAMRADPSLDSAVSVSAYNEYSPVRAKRITADGLIGPYVDVGSIPGASCDRDSADTCYFCDCSVWILRPICMELERGTVPFRWMGRRSLPLHQTGGLDIDHDYGIAMTEHWLRKHGFTETSTPYERV